MTLTAANSEYLYCVGRNDDAIAEAKRAFELDPLSLAINGSLSDAYYYARKYDDAIEQGRKVLKIDPNSLAEHFSLGNNFTQKKMYPEAVAEWQTWMKIRGDSGLADATAEAYRTSGFPGFLQAWINSQRNDSASLQRAFEIAAFYALLGNKNDAIVWLEKAYANRSGGMARVKAEPAFDSVRTDPGFREIIRRMNFPD